MDIREKLTLLGRAAQFDDCVTPATSLSSPNSSTAPGNFGLFAPAEATCAAGPDMFPYVSHVQTPRGERVPVLKVLQTSACQNNCHYCAFRAGRDIRRGTFAPDELARAFDLMQRSGVVRGIFLSSGVIGTNQTMDKMLATVELIRGKYDFRGYIHLKLLPGAQEAHIIRAIELADRVSVNLEAPTAETLAALAPQKRIEQLVGPLRVAAEMMRRNLTPDPSPARSGELHAPFSAQERRGGGAKLGLSTQFVVGPAGESDRDLLDRVQMLYREVRLARAYYSAFSPVHDTPLETAQPTDPRREFRLYQADWLLRYYGFEANEIPFGAAGNLSEDLDPKAAWAAAHPERFPIEVNRAPLPELLRIPGIGPTSARAIVQARKGGNLREIGDLRKLGARADRAAPFVVLAGKRPPYQPPLPL